MGYWGVSIFFFVFISGFFSFVFFHSHYLFLLLSFEIMMLSLFFILMFSFYSGTGGLLVLMIFLILMVCGAAFGISLLVNYVFSSGVEMFTLEF